MTCHFKDGKYKQPQKCITPNCRSKIFQPDRSSARTVDWQRIRFIYLCFQSQCRLQEQLDKKDPGRVPRTVEIDLTEDLVDSCVPGFIYRLKY